MLAPDKGAELQFQLPRPTTERYAQSRTLIVQAGRLCWGGEADRRMSMDDRSGYASANSKLVGIAVAIVAAVMIAGAALGA